MSCFVIAFDCGRERESFILTHIPERSKIQWLNVRHAAVLGLLNVRNARVQEGKAAAYFLHHTNANTVTVPV